MGINFAQSWLSEQSCEQASLKIQIITATPYVFLLDIGKSDWQDITILLEDPLRPG